MKATDSEVRKVIQLSIDGRQDEVESEMERIVRWDEDMIRRIIREEITRTTKETEGQVRRIGVLVTIIGGLIGLAFPVWVAFGAYIGLGIEPSAAITLVASLGLATLGAIVGRSVAK